MGDVIPMLRLILRIGRDHDADGQRGPLQFYLFLAKPKDDIGLLVWDGPGRLEALRVARDDYCDVRFLDDTPRANA
jgi:hypothetical protein